MSLEALVWQTGYCGTAAALAGFAFGMVRWRSSSPGQRLIALWLSAGAAADVLAYYFARHVRNSQQVAHYWFLATVILGVEALAAFQHSRQRARLFRACGLGYVVCWVVFALTIEPVSSYSTFSGPLAGIVLLGAAVATLFRRVAVGRRDFLEDSGFLIAVAVAAAAVPICFQTAAVQLWLQSHRSVAMGYYSVSNIVTVLAALIIIVALRENGGRDADRVA